MANVLKNTAASDLIAKLFLNEELADVHFKFKVDDEIQMVPANKVILAAISSVFHTMFYGSLKEGKEVEIKDADADAFKEFLQFFYLGEVTLTMENIETVVRLADKYDVHEYVNACAAFLISQLTLENMCWGYQLAINLKNDELIVFCEEKISGWPNEIFVTDSFKRCDRSTLKRILELDLTCDETKVFDACLTWAKYACEQNDLDVSQAENLRNQIGDCLKLIRFSAMTIEEFSNFVTSNDGLFTLEEFKDIVLTFTAKDYKPKIFNQNVRRYKFNENNILVCQRQNVGSSKFYLDQSEVVWFTSNEKVLLGEVHSVGVLNMRYDNDEQNNMVNVTIAEINNDHQLHSKKVLYEGSSKTWEGTRLRVSLAQPIVIKPHVIYEIHFEVLIGGGYSYYHANWSPTVELTDGLTVRFHRSPLYTRYDTSSNGWIESLSFNRL